MVPHFREKRTDAVRRRRAACVERRESEPGAEWARETVCIGYLALTDWLKELQCFSLWRHTLREREKESEGEVYYEWKSKELSWCELMCVFIYLKKKFTQGKILRRHMVVDNSNPHVIVTGTLHFTGDDLWGNFNCYTPSFCHYSAYRLHTALQPRNKF